MEVRSEVVSVRFTYDEREKLHQQAESSGMSMSEIIRTWTLGAKVHARRSTISDDVLRELSSWGNNLNQIARKLNEAGHAGLLPSLFESLQGELGAVHQAVQDLAERVR